MPRHNRRSLDDSLDIIHRAGLPHDVNVEVCQQVQQAVITTVKGTIAQAREEAMTAYVGCAQSAHLSQGRRPAQTRRGSYGREWRTPYAPITALRVPTLRRGNGPLHWQTITQSERGWGPRRDQQIMGSCLGLSLRDLQEMMQGTLGDVLALEACNRGVLA